jgi:putative copper resistance protein D
MVETPYGRLLALKILLFLILVAIALVNRFWLVPRISRDPVARSALRRAVGFEQGVGRAVLAVVSVLRTWLPAIYAGR